MPRAGRSRSQPGGRGELAQAAVDLLAPFLAHPLVLVGELDLHRDHEAAGLPGHPGVEDLLDRREEGAGGDHPVSQPEGAAEEIGELGDGVVGILGGASGHYDDRAFRRAPAEGRRGGERDGGRGAARLLQPAGEGDGLDRAGAGPGMKDEVDGRLAPAAPGRQPVASNTESVQPL